LPLVRKFRIPALFCAFAVLLCELIARPYSTMNICDDGPYILMARTLASTGHIVYNGWAAAMILTQLYLGAAFIKLFGFSFTTVRMSTLLIAMVTAFFLQRTLVRTNISERNATIGTLALVLSPLYLMLSVTFMSDITGLFAIVLCLYGCLRALQSSTDRSAIAWLCLAIAANVVFGTSRQIAWLGTLVMVPSTLWLLRSRRRVLTAGSAATLAGALLILASLQWLKHQPYVIPVPLLVSNFSLVQALSQLGLLFLDSPFLILPIIALFLPEARNSRPRVIAILSLLLLGFLFLATYPSHLRGYFSPLLEPTSGLGSWVTVHGIIKVVVLPGRPPIVLSPAIQVVLTIASIGGLLGLLLSLFRPVPPLTSSASTSWRQLALLVAPFSAAYCLLLLSAAGTTHFLYDRYALGLLIVALPCLVRFYQERIHPQLPLVSILLVAIMAAYGVALTHNTFALSRARVALADELNANGVPDTSLDGGWESNLDVELKHANHINNPLIRTPANGYAPTPPLPADTCPMYWYDRTPHIHPIYGVSFDSNACYGPAPFAPVHYSRWPYRTPGTLYVVRYIPSPKP
jgi:4-amino-4-deoxy-L-arabinose transferase-like glycosyltransferase